jgi:hypothetical protein
MYSTIAAVSGALSLPKKDGITKGKPATCLFFGSIIDSVM